jgi:hypothetical protein
MFHSIILAVVPIPLAYSFVSSAAQGCGLSPPMGKEEEEYPGLGILALDYEIANGNTTQQSPQFSKSIYWYSFSHFLYSEAPYICPDHLLPGHLSAFKCGLVLPSGLYSLSPFSLFFFFAVQGLNSGLHTC